MTSVLGPLINLSPAFQDHCHIGINESAMRNDY
jgi:hypothetical protein